jgi:hypothetical protein
MRSLVLKPVFFVTAFALLIISSALFSGLVEITSSNAQPIVVLEVEDTNALGLCNQLLDISIVRYVLSIDADKLTPYLKFNSVCRR